MCHGRLSGARPRYDAGMRSKLPFSPLVSLSLSLTLSLALGSASAGCSCNAGRPVHPDGSVTELPSEPSVPSEGPACGDGIVEGDETCDGDCPADCGPPEPGTCTVVSLVGAADACTAACEATPVSACVGGDGCCPAGCGEDEDRDCVPPGSVVWQVPLDGSEPTTPAVGDDAVYVGVRTPGDMVALGFDGAPLWRFETGWWWLSAPAVAEDGAVVFGSGSLGVVVLEPDGRLRWTFDDGGACLTTPALGGDGVVYTELADEALYALDLADGHVLWRVDLGVPESGDQPSVVVLADGTVVAGTRTGSVFGVRDGAVLWSFSADYGFQTDAAVDDDGTVYIAGGDFDLYAVDGAGGIGWTLPLGRYMDGAPVITDAGLVETGGALLRRFTRDGRELTAWDASPYTGTPAVAADGTLFVPGLQTLLFALDPQGRELWRIADDAFGGYRVGPALAPDGTVYFGRVAGPATQFQAVLYAVATGTTPPAPGRWSTEQGDVRRTGRVGGP